MKRFFFNAVKCQWYSSCITFKIGPKVVKFLIRSINTSSIISILSLGLFNPSFNIIILLVKTATNFDWCLSCLFMLCLSTENCFRKFVCASHLLNVIATLWKGNLVYFFVAQSKLMCHIDNTYFQGLLSFNLVTLVFDLCMSQHQAFGSTWVSI